MKKRIDWIDTLKGLGMFFVIWGHCFSTGTPIRKYIYSFHMPLFFFLSGLTCQNNFKLNTKDFIIKKIKTLLIPYLIINIVSILIIYIFSLFGLMNFKSLTEYFLGIIYSHTRIFTMPSNHTWFITSLFLIEIMFYFIQKYIKKDWQRVSISFILALISYINSVLPNKLYGPWHIEAAFMGIFFYSIGYVFIKKYEKFKKIFDKKIISFIYGGVLGIIGIIACYFNIHVSMYSGLYGNIIMFLVSSLASIFGLVLFTKIFLEKSRFFKTLGTYTLFILGYHIFLVTFIKRTFPILTTGNIEIFIFACIVTAIMFILSMFVYKKCPIFIGKNVDKLFKRKPKTT